MLRLPTPYHIPRQVYLILYYPLITITYLYNPITYNKRPINITNRQIRGIGDWLLEHYKNDKKKIATVYAKLLKL